MAKLFKSNQSVSYRKFFDLLLKLIDPCSLDVIKSDSKSDSNDYSDSSNEVLILESKVDYKVVDYNE